MSLKPRQACPGLDLPLLTGGRFQLAQAAPPAFTLLVFYRGLHCPICKTYTRDLDRRVGAFRERGVEVLALSMDTAERAARAKEKWQLMDLAVAHGLAESQARAWGLYISRAIKDSEPAVFSEPGVFLVRPDATLYWAAVQSMPFARPGFQDMLSAIEFVREKEYPARGEA